MQKRNNFLPLRLFVHCLPKHKSLKLSLMTIFDQQFGKAELVCLLMLNRLQPRGVVLSRMDSPQTTESPGNGSRRGPRKVHKWADKHNVHFQEWTQQELENLIDVVGKVPKDLRHKAQWTWISKAMTTERVFSIYDCHHAYTEFGLEKQRQEDAKKRRADEEEVEIERRRLADVQLKKSQQEWKRAYPKRFADNKANRMCGRNRISSCKGRRHAHELFSQLLAMSTAPELGDPVEWIFAVEELALDEKIWDDELSIKYGKILLLYRSRLYTDAYVSEDIQKALMACEADTLVVNVDLRRCLDTLCGETIMGSGKRKFGHGSNENIGMCQLYYLIASIRSEVIFKANYNNVLSPSKIFRRDVHKLLEEAERSLYLARRVIAEHKPYFDESGDSYHQSGADAATEKDDAVNEWMKFASRILSLATHVYGRALSCSGYASGLGAWSTHHEERRNAASKTVAESAKLIVQVFLEKALEEQEAATFQKLRDTEKKRLYNLNLNDLNTRIEGLRKQYRAAKKTIKQVGARAQKKCDEISMEIKSLDEDKKVVIALNGRDRNKFAKMDCKRILKARIDTTIGTRLPKSLTDVHSLKQEEETEFTKRYPQFRAEVDRVLTPRTIDFQDAERYLEQALMHFENSGFLPKYYYAIVLADLGRLYYYIAVVQEAEGVEVIGVSTEPSIMYKQSIETYQRALKVLIDHGASCSVLYGHTCEELSQVHSRQHQWGDQSEAFVLCQNAIAVYEKLGDTVRSQAAIERAQTFSMYQVDEDSVETYRRAIYGGIEGQQKK